MTLSRVTQKSKIRGDPICCVCGTNIRKLFNKGLAVYSISCGRHPMRYYCKKCKVEKYGGVKLRDEE